MKFPYLGLVGVLIVLLAASPSVVRGQSGLAELRGVVKDESGGALPGASVRALNVETGLRRETQTSSSGAYTMPGLPPGTYEIRAELAGFTTAAVRSVLGVGDVLSHRLIMKVATVQETVTVIAPRHSWRRPHRG